MKWFCRLKSAFHTQPAGAHPAMGAERGHPVPAQPGDGCSQGSVLLGSGKGGRGLEWPFLVSFPALNPIVPAPPFPQIPQCLWDALRSFCTEATLDFWHWPVGLGGGTVGCQQKGALKHPGHSWMRRRAANVITLIQEYLYERLPCQNNLGTTSSHQWCNCTRHCAHTRPHQVCEFLSFLLTPIFKDADVPNSHSF